MAEVTVADLYRALLDPVTTPKGEVPGWLPERRWVLSWAAVRAIAAEQRIPVGDVSDGGFLLGLPFRVDDSVEGFALEPFEVPG